MKRKKIVLLTNHYWQSKKKAGFHFLAEAYQKEGFEVVFVTAVFSLIKLATNRFLISERNFLGNVIFKRKHNGVSSIVNISLTHPIKTRWKLMEIITSFLFKLNRKTANEIRDAHIIIFESTPALLFFHKVRKLNKKAKMIYRMSDDLEVIRVPKSVVDYERKIISKFDLVSVPTKSMFDKFKIISQDNIYLNYHGLKKTLYDEEVRNPYDSNRINHIFVGNSHIDQLFLAVAAGCFTDHLFHIIGPYKDKVKKNNVIFYGMMRYEDTIPFIKNADIGLQIRLDTDGAAKTLADSLKMIQYTYCKLPIIAPSSIPANHRSNVIFYEYKDEESIKKCIEECLKFDRSSFYEPVDTWEDMVKHFIQHTNIEVN